MKLRILIAISVISIMIGVIFVIYSWLFLSVTVTNKSNVNIKDIVVIFPNTKCVEFGDLAINETATRCILDETGEGSISVKYNDKLNTIDSYVTSMNEDFIIEIHKSGPLITTSLTSR